jgi:hypothetical protein
MTPAATPSPVRQSSPYGRRRLAGYALGATLWTPIYAPILLGIGRALSHLGVTPMPLAPSIVTAWITVFVTLLVSARKGAAAGPAVNHIFIAPDLRFGERLRQVWSTWLGMLMLIALPVFALAAFILIAGVVS